MRRHQDKDCNACMQYDCDCECVTCTEARKRREEESLRQHHPDGFGGSDYDDGRFDANDRCEE